MEITAKMVKELRESTGAGMMDCKKALKECDGDMEKSVEFLRKKGIASASKKEGRATSQGIVGSYIHGEKGCCCTRILEEWEVHCCWRGATNGLPAC